MPSRERFVHHRPVLILMGLAILAALSGSVQARQFQDSGKFVISVGSKPVGTEDFRIHTEKDKVVVTSETNLTASSKGKLLKFHTSADLVLNSQLQPQSYTWKQSGAQSSHLKVDFRTSPATAEYHTVNGKTDLRQFNLPKSFVVLDDNALCHYEMLVDLFNQSSGAQQSFTAFIPQEALPGQLSIAKTGEQEIEIAGRKIKTAHYLVTTALAQIDLWVDKDGRLERVSMPAVQLTADRQ